MVCHTTVANLLDQVPPSGFEGNGYSIQNYRSPKMTTVTWVTLRKGLEVRVRIKVSFCSNLGQISVTKSKRTKRVVWDPYQVEVQETDNNLGLCLFIPVAQLQHQLRRGFKHTFSCSETSLLPYFYSPRGILFHTPNQDSLPYISSP